MHKFKVGDKVRVKKLTIAQFRAMDTGEYKAGVWPGLEDLCDTLLVVKNLSISGNLKCLDIHGGEYFYSPNWIEPAVKFKGNK